MKKKILVALSTFLIIGVIAIIFIPRYRIDKTFTYDIDKENGEVTITGYLADDRARDRYNNGDDEELAFPEKIEVPEKIKGYPVTAIGDRAFEWSKAKEIVLPETVKKIGNSAFFHCEELEEITGTDNVEVIGNFAFSGCKELQGLHMPKLSDIGESAFSGNIKLEEAILPETMKVLPYAMCMRMQGLTEVSIPESVVSIESRVFAFCDSLKEIYIPPSVTDIHRGTFEGIEEQITIVGVKGSYAEEYANEMGIAFQEVSQ